MKNLPVSRRPAPYRVFRTTRASAALVLQIRDPETGERVEPSDLEGYRVIRKMDCPWQDAALPRGSRLLLTPKAARYLLASGTIVALEEPPLIISRDTVAKPGG